MKKRTYEYYCTKFRAAGGYEWNLNDNRPTKEKIIEGAICSANLTICPYTAAGYLDYAKHLMKSDEEYNYPWVKPVRYWFIKLILRYLFNYKMKP